MNEQFVPWCVEFSNAVRDERLDHTGFDEFVTWLDGQKFTDFDIPTDFGKTTLNLCRQLQGRGAFSLPLETIALGVIDLAGTEYPSVFEGALAEAGAPEEEFLPSFKGTLFEGRLQHLQQAMSQKLPQPELS